MNPTMLRLGVFVALLLTLGMAERAHVRPLPAALIAFAALGLVIYMQHRVMHRVGARFHPLEILLSIGVKIATVVLLGAPAAIVLTFEIVLSSFALVTHANIALSLTHDRLLRSMFVTPDMHRIHHSILRKEHDTNFGFHVSWWDRLFGSYTPQPRESQTCMPSGLTTYRAEADQRLLALLRQPFGAH